MSDQSTSIDHLDPGIQYLIKLLELGLYIRGWNGSDTPYIALDKCPDRYQIYDVMPLHFVNFYSFAESLDTTVVEKIHKLPIMRYINKKFFGYNHQYSSHYLESIGTLLDGLFNQKFEYIYASGYLISTSIYHLEHSYQYIVPNIKITTLKEFW